MDNLPWDEQEMNALLQHDDLLGDDGMNFLNMGQFELPDGHISSPKIAPPPPILQPAPIEDHADSGSHQQHTGSGRPNYGDVSRAMSMSTATGRSKEKRGPRPRLFKKNHCQVDDCHANLAILSFYHQRNHICGEHLKAESFAVRGVLSRFCQRCGLSHPLSEFDGTRKSCRLALHKHNNRRRAKQMFEPTALNRMITQDSQQSSQLPPSGGPVYPPFPQQQLDDQMLQQFLPVMQPPIFQPIMPGIQPEGIVAPQHLQQQQQQPETSAESIGQQQQQQVAITDISGMTAIQQQPQNGQQPMMLLVLPAGTLGPGSGPVNLQIPAGSQLVMLPQISQQQTALNDGGDGQQQQQQ